MAKNTKSDMSCARVKQYQSSDIGLCERHNERKNESYNNINVVSERIDMNMHYKSPDSKSYMDILRQIETDGKVSKRGLRQDATLFDEIIIDVNPIHFERKGGYEYAKEFLCRSLSSRCKTPELCGTVKAVINQISHSKKWASDILLTDDNGNVILRKNGKTKYRASYSILKDKLFEHMSERGFTGFQRGQLGRISENLTSLQYQIMKDKERLTAIQEKYRVSR